ncbi:MAG: OadG family transporter subunit [Arcobacteraceae bacterium]
MEENLLIEAIKFMILGMSVVFAFLTIMVYAIKLQAVLINKFFPIVEKQAIQKAQPQVAESNTAKKIAAISAVIQHHNNLKG